MPKALFPSHADPQMAQVILGGIAASIMTVVSIVFAILLMTLTLASMQFSPRIIVGFTKDRVTQWTLGVFLGTFSYCIAALPAARSLPSPFAPVATVLGAMVLAGACVALLLFFIHHISLAISVNHIVDRIASETETMVNEMMPWPRKLSRMAASDPIQSTISETGVSSNVSGYIRFIDTSEARRPGKDPPCKTPCSPACGPVRSRRNPAAGGVESGIAFPLGEALKFARPSTSVPPEPCSRMWNSGSCRSLTSR